MVKCQSNDLTLLKTNVFKIAIRFPFECVLSLGCELQALDRKQLGGMLSEIDPNF